MTTEIPTYTIGEVDEFNFLVQTPGSPFMVGFTEGMGISDGSRFYYQPIMVGSPSLMYGPGSATYEILKVESVTDGDVPLIVSIPIDPKTYIDNYGYVHIGESNFPPAIAGLVNPVIRITFKYTYHYINPSTGETFTLEGETYFSSIRYNEALFDEMLRSIPYAAPPSNSIISD